jgi:hypothetical protein
MNCLLSNEFSDSILILPLPQVITQFSKITHPTKRMLEAILTLDAALILLLLSHLKTSNLKFVHGLIMVTSHSDSS